MDPREGDPVAWSLFAPHEQYLRGPWGCDWRQRRLQPQCLDCAEDTAPRGDEDRGASYCHRKIPSRQP
ncbi:hypothetical protein ATO13_19235 [Stappia sp. 22II-S9-Z10]|nr:hypothetical protein ATO13_19235 [Stappia sp. 22II-S9-Z10]